MTHCHCHSLCTVHCALRTVHLPIMLVHCPSRTRQSHVLLSHRLVRLAVTNAVAKRDWPDTIALHYAPLAQLKEEWQRLVVRAAASHTEAQRERAALLRRCQERWKQQLLEAEHTATLAGDALSASFLVYRSSIGASDKKDRPQTEAEFKDALRFQREYLFEALTFMKLSRVDEPRVRTRTSAHAAHVEKRFTNEWPDTIAKYRALDALTESWDNNIVLADAAPTKDVQVQQAILKNLRAEFAKQLDEVSETLAMTPDVQRTVYTSYSRSLSKSVKKVLPQTFEHYLDALFYQQWYLTEALAVMNVEEKSAAEIFADGKRSSFERQSDSTCIVA